MDALAIPGLATNWYPGRQRKVDRFRDIEARVETTVVGGRSGDDKLSLFLDQLVHLDTIGEENARLNKRRFVAEELITLLVEIFEELVSELLKLFGAVEVDRVPELRLAVVQIVDGV